MVKNLCIALAVRQTESLWKLSAKSVTVRHLDCEMIKKSKYGTGGQTVEQDYDVCYECTGYGDDYYINDDGELECYCPYCYNNGMESEED